MYNIQLNNTVHNTIIGGKIWSGIPIKYKLMYLEAGRENIKSKCKGKEDD